MRILLIALLIAACSPKAPKPPADKLLFAAAERDRLCVAGERGGLIVYGEGEANCSARGRIERSGDRLVLFPDADSDCRIEAKVMGDRLLLGTRSEACAYYCGPGADYGGKSMTKSQSDSPAVDFAGDPLC